jgi:hypothetical protein
MPRIEIFVFSYTDLLATISNNSPRCPERRGYPPSAHHEASGFCQNAARNLAIVRNRTWQTSISPIHFSSRLRIESVGGRDL